MALFEVPDAMGLNVLPDMVPIRTVQVAALLLTLLLKFRRVTDVNSYPAPFPPVAKVCPCTGLFAQMVLPFGFEPWPVSPVVFNIEMSAPSTVGAESKQEMVPRRV